MDEISYIDDDYGRFIIIYHLLRFRIGLLRNDSYPRQHRGLSFWYSRSQHSRYIEISQC